MPHAVVPLADLPQLHTAPCPACAGQVAARFFDGGRQPLATIAWPETPEEARAMPRLANDFVRCVQCGHVFNQAFRYDDVPYAKKPNLMFNRGGHWSQFIQSTRDHLLAQLPPDPVVVEVGYGDGTFLAALAGACPSGRFVGFDPNGAPAPTDSSLDLRAELFDPRVHLVELGPDLIILRHVLEHLTSSLAFLQLIATTAALVGQRPLAYCEVPCIDRVLETGRTVDFYYEHNSQFTTTSFTTMLERCGGEVLTIGHGYDGEVLAGLVRLTASRAVTDHARQAAAFQVGTEVGLVAIRRQLQAIVESGQRVAIWGGTGKSAAFIQRYGLDAERFPLVVDSDPQKAGTYVPGTGQLIQFRDVLDGQAVDVLIIPPQWRARDILEEAARHGIHPQQVLIEHQGRLIDFHCEPHPYPIPYEALAA